MSAVLARPVPRAGWQADAACARGVDYTAIDTDRHPDYPAGKAACAACPVLDECRTTALGVLDLAGLAGGLLAGQRRAYRARHGLRVTTSTRDWLPADVALRDAGKVPDRVPDHVVAQVSQLAADGLTGAEIAVRLGIGETTVKHCRQLANGGRTRGMS
jgi:hypothetical protein